jgi:hypothetical protein
MPAGVSAYTALANVTLGSSASSVTFSSISQAYRDLVLVINAPAGGVFGYLRFNGDSGSNYSAVRMYGSGTATGSDTGLIGSSAINISEFYNEQNLTTVNIMDYSATDKHKTVLSRANAPAYYVFGIAGRWANTAAITSLVVSPSSGTFNSGGTFALYGVQS